MRVLEVVNNRLPGMGLSKTIFLAVKLPFWVSRMKPGLLSRQISKILRLFSIFEENDARFPRHTKN